MTDLQQQVVDRAKRALENEKWFRGVCIDNLPKDSEIERDGVEESAQQLISDTYLWDGYYPSK